MMRALEAGGMTVSRSDEADALASKKFRREDYDPNPNGYYELPHQWMNQPGWLENQEGKVFKLFLPNSVTLPADRQRYRAIFCWRDPWELRESWLQTFGEALPRSHYEEWQDRFLGIMKQRRDFEVETAVYADIIADPYPFFRALQGRGWRIDPEKAAEAIDPALYRNRYPVFNKEESHAEGISVEEVRA